MTMTAKHVSLDRREVLVECERVIAERIDRTDRHASKVIIIEPGGHSDAYEDGTVYVMNDAGATVSQWFITAPQPKP